MFLNPKIIEKYSKKSKSNMHVGSPNAERMLITKTVCYINEFIELVDQARLPSVHLLLS